MASLRETSESQAVRPVRSLIYVSRKTLPGRQASADVDAILAVSRSRNRALQVTGALVSAATTFAQLIEGPPPAIDALMDSIKGDPRHTDVKVITIKDNMPRKFADWAMAYSGDEAYIERHLKRLLEPLPPKLTTERAEQLEMLMEEFSKRLNH